MVGADDENKLLNLLSIVVLHGGWGSREKEEKSGDELRFSRRGRGRSREWAGEIFWSAMELASLGGGHGHHLIYRSISRRRLV